MKTKLLTFIVIALLSSQVFGVPGDANEPYVCEQEVFEGPFEALLRIVDPDGNYLGNEIFVEWLEVPNGITILEDITDGNEYLCEPMDICKFYKASSTYLTVGTKVIKRKQGDSAGNWAWHDDIIIVKRLPDKTAPVSGCWTILSQGGG